MSNRIIRLSGNELAFTLAQAGRPDLGQGILQGMTDVPLSSEDAMQRLLAAGHSLLARQLLSIDAEAHPVLGEDLTWLAGVLTGAPFSLRYTLTTAEAVYTLTYHRTATGVVEHLIEQGVVHVFTAHEGTEAAVDGGATFYHLDESQPSLAGEGTLTQQLLEEAQGARDAAQIRAALGRSALPPELREALAEDLAQGGERGTVLRIEFGPGGELSAERGLLILRATTRLWMLRPQQGPGGAIITVISGAPEMFRREVAALLK